MTTYAYAAIIIVELAGQYSKLQCSEEEEELVHKIHKVAGKAGN